MRRKESPLPITAMLMLAIDQFMNQFTRNITGKIDTSSLSLDSKYVYTLMVNDL